MSTKLFTCRGIRLKRQWAMVSMVAMLLLGTGPAFIPTVKAQTQVAPVGAGFTVDAGDLRFIYEQILVAQDHAAGGTLLGPGPNQVHDPQHPRGLRTVDGSFNNLVPVPDQHLFGASDLVFPRLTVPNFRSAEQGTSYTQTTGNVFDSQPRIITNLIVDQSANNPAALAVASNPCGSGGFVCSTPASLADVTDPDSGALFIPNITPDFGLSAPFNLMFTFFGQFFDHGLDLVNKGGSGAVIMPLQPDDPLFVPGSQTNFMVLTRATNQPGPDGVLGTADDIHDGINQTTPWVDQNQTYTSHPSHQVFLREYTLNAAGQPVQSGKVLGGGFCAPRPTGIAGDMICNIGNWAEVKAQAATKLGIHFNDQDVFDVPLILTDPYGHFKPGPRGFPQLVLPGNVLLEGDPTANGGAGIDIPATAFRTNHQFLIDIAHNAAPNPGLVADADTDVSVFGVTVQPPGTYDDELLNLHFVTGDGRGNENIALTMVHQLFHAEHNRLAHDIDRQINTLLTPAEIAAWHAVHAGSGWDYGERLFQAARFVTEMEYQHLVFEEFARTIQPQINPFLGGITSINGAIAAEFAHTVYRLGHSMLPERIGRINTTIDPATGAVVETPNDVRLLTAFLNPVAFNDGGAAGPLTADKAAGAIIRGVTRQIGNELDEFVTSSVRNTLVGLPLDLPAINIARGRSEGIPPLNEARRQFFAATKDQTLAPYANWFEFGLGLKHIESLVNFVAAYGTHPTITGATTVAAKRSAAQALVSANDPFLFSPAATSGLDNVDFWPGGMAEKQAVFGGLLGTTFNFVFEKQLESLQDGDRFYYLQRLDGLNLVAQLESNSLAELARRNTDIGGTMDVIFNTADLILDVASFPGTAPVVLDPLGGLQLLTLADGTKFFFDPLHTGKNIVFNGTAADDRMRADVGDDTMFGNGGNDRMDGGEGNDTLLGGDGDDVLFGNNGDDVLKGGPGNDAMNAGPGFNGDLLLGSDGNDFMVGGDDGQEYFGGLGNDFIVDGVMRAEAIFGNTGDDWLDDGDGHDGGMFGDDGNVFDLLAGLSAIGGDDVLGGGPGQDNHFGEGGDDMFVMSEGSNKFFGDFGFDWISLRGWNAPEFIELDLLAQPLVNLNFNDLRNRYRFVDGASGWKLNDHIAGSNHVLPEPGEVVETLLAGMELTPAGAAKITGLTELMTAFGQPLPFMGGNILLGGEGNDVLEGKKGDDLIDGDLWLNVQLEATMNDGTIKMVNGPRELVDDVFADPQRLNPGKIRTVRSIVTPPAVPSDCGAAAPRNCDTAVFAFPRADYTITVNANGTVTVTHVPARNADIPFSDGSDTLRNIELLQFTDQTIPVPGAAPATVLVPSVVGQPLLTATATITGAGLTFFLAQDASTIVPIGSVISQVPAAGASVAPGTPVLLTISQGTLVPNVVNLNQAAAVTALADANLTATFTFANSSTIARGNVISQAPGASSFAQPGSNVALVVSLGPSGVVLALGFDEASDTTAIDSSPSARNGTITGAVRVPGMVGSALSFDGVDDWVTVIDGATGTPLDLTTGMTIEAWVNPTVMNGWETIVLKERGLNAMSYALYANDGAPLAGGVAAPAGYVRTGGIDQGIRGTAALATGTWTHLATTYDGVNQRLYVNGVQVASRAQTGLIATGNAPLRIGGNASFAGEFFQGLIDDVRLYNRALTAAEIGLDMSATGGAPVVTPPPPPPPATPSPTDGLVLSLNFDEASGTTAIDSSTSGRNGTITGASHVPGKVGNALSFNGVSDWVTVVDGAAGTPLDLTAGMTIEAWVNPAALNGWNTVVLKERGANALSYALYANDGAPEPGGVAAPAGYVRAQGIDQGIQGVSALTLNTWTHLATTYDGTTQRIYVNGVEVASRPQGGGIAVGDEPLRIGGNGSFAGGEFFQGLIDQVRIYNRALSASEVNADMNAGVPPTP